MLHFHSSPKNLFFYTCASIVLCLQSDATELDIDGGILDDGIPGEFTDYLISDNTRNIPDSSATDGTVTLILRDEAICQWNNAGYPFFQQYEINFHPGGLDLPFGSSSLQDSIALTTYYTVIVESSDPIDISNLTLRFWRNDRNGPPRRYYILYDGDNNGYDVGDVIADSANFPEADDKDLIPLDHFGVDFTKEFSVDPGISASTREEFRFYVSNTPNLAGNTHLIYAGITYDAGGGPVVLPSSLGIGLDGSDIEVSIPGSLSSQTYSLEISTDEFETWDPVDDQVPSAPASGNDGTLILTDPNATSTQDKAFYRINVQ